MRYPREQHCVGQDSSVLQANRKNDRYVEVRPDLPCNVIVIHGVNDVGTRGERKRFISASYRMPSAKDKDVVEPDPDAMFFKRKINDKTHSPVIPFAGSDVHGARCQAPCRADCHDPRLRRQ